MVKLLNIIEEILNLEKGSIKIDDLKKEIEEWDSLANIQIIAEIEEAFNITIPIEDIRNIEKVRDFLKYI